MIVIRNKSKSEHIGKEKSVFEIDKEKSHRCPTKR